MDKATVRKTRHAVFDVHLHLVFVTKYRAKVFTDELLVECERVMTKVCGDFQVVLEEFKGESDHVHLLVSVPPTVQVSRLVNSLKGVSSRRLREADPDHVGKFLWDGRFWSRSYYVGSSGGAALESLKRYVKDQDRPK